MPNPQGLFGRCSCDAQEWPFGRHVYQCGDSEGMGGRNFDEVELLQVRVQGLVHHVVLDEMDPLVLAGTQHWSVPNTAL